MITQVPARHNGAAACLTLLGWSVLVFLVWAGAGCNQETDHQATPQVDPPQEAASCHLTADTTAWIAFKEIVQRISKSEKVTRPELESLGNLPSVTLWRESLGDFVPDSRRVGNWLEGAFWEELGHTGSQKMNTDRSAFRRSFRFSWDSRKIIDQKVAVLAGPRKCELREGAEFWIEPGRLPDTLVVYFLPAKPEIRFFEGSLLVDTGVVGASEADQVIRQMTGLLYRNFQNLPGPSPADLAGDEAVAHIFRVLVNEGVAGWIEQTPTTEFGGGHPSLAKFQIIPEHFFFKAQEAIQLMNLHLESMLEDEDAMAAKAHSLVMTLGAMNAYGPTGFGMASAIAVHLGEERLRDAGRSVPAFLDAYQEAANLNPVPVPVPGAPGTELHETVPPLNPDVFVRLQSILRREFPQ